MIITKGRKTIKMTTTKEKALTVANMQSSLRASARVCRCVILCVIGQN